MYDETHDNCTFVQRTNRTDAGTQPMTRNAANDALANGWPKHLIQHFHKGVGARFEVRIVGVDVKAQHPEIEGDVLILDRRTDRWSMVHSSLSAPSQRTVLTDYWRTRALTAEARVTDG